MPRQPAVDAWFAGYDNPMKAVVLRVREIILDADARIDECVKWSAPTFTYKGNLASFFPKSKQHASLMFHLGAQIPGHHPRLEGGGDVGRMLKVGNIAEANAARGDIERLVRAWCDWRDTAGAKQASRAAKKAATKKTATKKAPTTTKKPAGKKKASKKTP